MRKGIDHIGIAIAFFCHDGSGKFLIGKRSQNTRDEQGRWESGGGSLELGETIEEALHRELKEEYSTTPLSYEYLGYREVHREHEGIRTHWILFDFKVLVDPNEVKIGEPDMIDEIGWYSLDTLPQPLHSQVASTITRYYNQLSIHQTYVTNNTTLP